MIEKTPSQKAVLFVRTFSRGSTFIQSLSHPKDSLRLEQVIVLNGTTRHTLLSNRFCMCTQECVVRGLHAFSPMSTLCLLSRTISINAFNLLLFYLKILKIASENRYSITKKTGFLQSLIKIEFFLLSSHKKSRNVL
ncbi:hypothetical protein JOC28_000480 [Streptococcus loxodontisalivarius]|uniref:Uncharacterized protein n=1 Tax=Streptococcus loxodontisalivarius TaxID=1349415 RepID=A0ABS2PS29_9STRE|nr:hypothetical protein [Streptococcus loxodontisalivarius]